MVGGGIDDQPHFETNSLTRLQSYHPTAENCSVTASVRLFSLCRRFGGLGWVPCGLAAMPGRAACARGQAEAHCLAEWVEWVTSMTGVPCEPGTIGVLAVRL